MQAIASREFLTDDNRLLHLYKGNKASIMKHITLKLIR